MAIYYFNLVAARGRKKRLIAKVLASSFGEASSDSKTNQTYNYIIKRNGLLGREIMLPFQRQDLIDNCSKPLDYLELNKYRKDTIFAKKQSDRSTYQIKSMLMQSPYLLLSDKIKKRFKVDQELN